MKTKDYLVYVIMGGLFLIPFIALIVPDGMFFPYITGKGFTFRILVEILFGLYVILAFYSPEFRPKMSWITKSIGVFAIAILIADLLSANVSKSLWSNYERMEGFVLIAHLVLYYIVASGVLRKASDWYNWFNISIFASVIMSIYGIGQLMGWKGFTISQGGVRLDGTFGNASYLAIYLVFHIFLCLYMLVKTSHIKWAKWVYGSIAAIEMILLYYTATRGAILGLIAGVVISALIIGIGNKDNKIYRKVGIGVLIGAVILVLSFFAIRNQSFVKESPVLSRFASMNLSEIKNQGRYYVWPMAIKGFVERPIFGWGQESFNFVFNKNYDPRMYTQEQWFDRTHNVILDWLIAGGLVGLLSYLSILVALIYCIWKKGNDLSINEKGLLTGLISAYVFHNMFVFDNLLSYIMFFSILGYIHSRDVSGKEYKGRLFSVFSKDIVTYAVTPIMIVVTIAGIYFVNAPAIQANRMLILALSGDEKNGVDKNLADFKKVFEYNSFGSSEALEQLISFDSKLTQSTLISDTIKNEFLKLTSEQINKKLEKTPNDARYLIYASNFYNVLGQYDQAIVYANRALENSPRKPSIYFEIGSSYLGKKDYAKALEMFKNAYDLEPNYPEAQKIYALGAVYNKNMDILMEMVNKVGYDQILYDDRFLRAFFSIGDMQSVLAMSIERVNKDPNNLNHMMTLASVYLELGQKQSAIQVIQKMIEIDPNFKTDGESYIKQINGL